ncbi:MAG TPA: hypothetical protein VGO11_20880 [Chthoniobacteraceae bacterium]|jgi:hypothetical protein|nr:hypothetical protein [Chthoniobacteraceae bacterium]
MSEESKKAPTHPLVAIAGSCAGSSVGIAFLAFFLMHNITDSGMWAIACITAPSVMGCVIAFFMTTRQP